MKIQAQKICLLNSSIVYVMTQNWARDCLEKEKRRKNEEEKRRRKKRRHENLGLVS